METPAIKRYAVVAGILGRQLELHFPYERNAALMSTGHVGSFGRVGIFAAIYPFASQEKMDSPNSPRLQRGWRTAASSFHYSCHLGDRRGEQNPLVEI